MESTKQLHKRWRKSFREGVFERDNNVCLICNKNDGNLDAHHITDRHEMPNGGYVLENGISLCSDHHIKAERKEVGFEDFRLYSLIKSSKALALSKSRELK